MTSWVSRLPVFVRDVSNLSLGTIAGQAILLLASPVVSRLYTPSEFGAFSAMLGVATLLATLCSLSFPVAIPLARTQREASDLTWMTVLAGVCIAPGATFVAAMAMWRIGEMSAPVSLWGVGAATAVFLSTWGALRALAARDSRFRALSFSSVTDSGVQAGGQVALGQLAWGAPGLAGGYLAGKVAAVGLLAWGARTRLLAPRRPWVAARAWVRYSLWVTPTTLLNQASVTAISPFIAALFGATIAGNFALASRILAVPAALIGQAIATVFFPKISLLAREGSPTLPVVLPVATALASIALPVFGFTLLLGPELFSLVFGAQWREAGVVAAILSPWLALSLVSSPISSVATVHERLSQLLALGVLESSLRFAALAVGAHLGRWTVGAALYSATGCAISLYTTAWALSLSGGSVVAWLRSWTAGRWTLLVALGTLAAIKPIVPDVAFATLASLTCIIGTLVGARELLALRRDWGSVQS